MIIPQSEQLIIYSYCAGFLDGEGCIFARTKFKNGFPAGYMAITASQVSIEPLLLLKKTFGGSIHKCKAANERCRPTWRWALTGRKAADCCENILPFLKVKSEQAKILIEFSRTMISRPGRRGHPKEIWDKRNEFTSRLHVLNQRGVTAWTA